MKKIKPYLPALIFTFLTVLLHILPVYAITTSTLDSSAFATLTSGAMDVAGDGELLYVNNGKIDVVPNSYVTSTGGQRIVNLGAYASYPNPNGMFNLYNEATNSPILSASFMGSTTEYVQMFCQNLNPNGSCDMVAADDKGTATSSDHYVDFGIANSRQSDSAHTLIGPYDAYLYNQSSRLLIGSATTTASSSIVFSLGMQTGSPSFALDRYGHMITHGTNPSSLSGCGTSPSVVGNDTNGVISLGTGISVTACTMSFANSFPSGSNVTCSVSSNSTLSFGSVTAVSNTGFSVGLSIGLGGGKLYYQCMASN